MASEVQICNRALQKVGAKRITNLTDDSNSARACLAAYESVRDAELQKNRWNFSIQRYEIAADAEAPAWGRENSFTLPEEVIEPIPPYPEDNSADRDWVVENGKILTNDSAPLYLRATTVVTDPNKMSPLFREALACALALEICEELTQSNQKKESLKADYKEAIAQARRRNAIMSVPAEAPASSWITGRE